MPTTNQFKDKSEFDTVFAVYKHGFYGHGIHAVSTEKDEAIFLSRRAAAREPDGYHVFHVFEVPLNQKSPKIKLEPHEESFRRDLGWMQFDSLYAVSKDLKKRCSSPDVTSQNAKCLLDEIQFLTEEQKHVIGLEMRSESCQQDPNRLNIEAEPMIIRDDSTLFFVVYKRGNFGHGVHAISMSLQECCLLAKAIAGRDIDDYHAYEVYTIPASQLPRMESMCSIDFGWMNKEPIFCVTKSGIKQQRRGLPIKLDRPLLQAERNNLRQYGDCPLVNP